MNAVRASATGWNASKMPWAPLDTPLLPRFDAETEAEYKEYTNHRQRNLQQALSVASFVFSLLVMAKRLSDTAPTLAHGAGPPVGLQEGPAQGPTPLHYATFVMCTMTLVKGSHMLLALLSTPATFSRLCTYAGMCVMLWANCCTFLLVWSGDIVKAWQCELLRGLAVHGTLVVPCLLPLLYPIPLRFNMMMTVVHMGAAGALYAGPKGLCAQWAVLEAAAWAAPPDSADKLCLMCGDMARAVDRKVANAMSFFTPVAPPSCVRPCMVMGMLCHMVLTGSMLLWQHKSEMASRIAYLRAHAPQMLRPQGHAASTIAFGHLLSTVLLLGGNVLMLIYVQ